MLDSLKSLLVAKGINAPIEINTAKPTRDGAAWLWVKHWQLEGKDFYKAWFGDYSKSYRDEWKSGDDRELTEAQRSEAEAKLKEIVELELIEREKLHEARALKLADEWETFSETGTTPYLTRKQIASLFGARVKANDQGSGILIVPARDVKGRFWNYQRIYSEKMSKGDKFFAEGAKTEGCFHILQGELQDDVTVYLAEGYATACSVAMALGSEACVVASFNANNLQPVATSIREAYPGCKVIVCADNDAFTVIEGKPYNVGLEKGRRAAGAVSGACVWPIFRTPQKGFTDFNDLHCSQGLATVKDQILHPENHVKGIQPMCLNSKNGKLVKPSFKQVNDHLLTYYKDTVICKDSYLYKFVGSHWELCAEADENKIRQDIDLSTSYALKMNEINAHFDYFKMNCHSMGKHETFQANPDIANFQNGTLYFDRKGLENYTTRFEPRHEKRDYQTSTLPFDYPSPQATPPLTPKFDLMLENLFSQDEDKEEKKKLVLQLMGATLMPLSPVIAIFQGPPGAAKSSLIKLIIKMIQDHNCSKVQLSEMKGFHLASMAGKLLNYSFELDATKGMVDHVVKQILDRDTIRVERKYRDDLYIRIPAVHLFACNDLPRSYEGHSKAYGRRMIVIKMGSFKATEKTARDYERYVWEEEKEGIIYRAVHEGLADLMGSNGFYTRPASSGKAIEEMETNSDLVQQFLDDIANNEVDAENNYRVHLNGEIDPKKCIEKTKLWHIFEGWQNSVEPDVRRRIGKNTFYQRFELKGIVAQQQGKTRHFIGFTMQHGGSEIT